MNQEPFSKNEKLPTTQNSESFVSESDEVSPAQTTSLPQRDSIPPVTPKWAVLVGVCGAIATVGTGFYTLFAAQTLQPFFRSTPTPTITPAAQTYITALGRLEPGAKVIQLSAPMGIDGARIAELAVKGGDKVARGEVIAILDSRDRLLAALQVAEEQVKIAQARLAQVQAGAKAGDISAQEATIQRLDAQLQGEIATQSAAIARLEAQLRGQVATQSASIDRLEAELAGERSTQKAAIARVTAERQGEITAQQATIARLEAELENARREYQRYQQLYGNGAISASELDTRLTTLETVRASLNEAKANYRRIQATLQEEFNEATAKLNMTENTLEKQLAEARANLQLTRETLQEQLAEARANLRLTQATVQEQTNEARGTLASIAEVRPTDIQAAEAELDSAIAAVAKAEADLEIAYIKAPVAGTILKIHTQPGEVVGNDGIVELGQTDQMYVVAEVYETDISKVRPGQPATINSAAFDGELQGIVETIGLKIAKKDVLDADPAADVDVRVVEVKIRLDPIESKRVAGLTNLQVEVKIEI